MVLSTEWTQVEVIELLNDGSGIGFGIVGGRSTGVVVKSILPGGLADKDGRLQSGDHILQIGEVNVRGFSSEHVATVLRQTGAEVRMVIARPVEPSSSHFINFATDAPVVPTKIVINADDLDYHLILNGYEPIGDENFDIDYYRQINEIDVEEESEGGTAVETPANEDEDGLCNGVNGEQTNDTNTVSSQQQCVVIQTEAAIEVVDSTADDADLLDDDELTLPETEKFTVELDKTECGLGITIAGYVCEREDLSGIFVKSIGVGSEADKCKRIRVNDRIVEVDSEGLRGLTNYEAVEKLKSALSGPVLLTFERYLRGPKYEHLQEALACQEVQKDRQKESPVSPSVKTLSWIPIDAEIELDPDGEETTSLGSTGELALDLASTLAEREIFVDERFEADPNADVETSIRRKWCDLIGADADVVVAHLTKLTGLGISLEGTVDVEQGIEVRPRHYIRSILPEGPVGQNGKLSSGDELLEVNGQKLLGIRHVEVVKILKELPSAVRLVCARKSETNRVINTSQDIEGFEARNILGGSLKTLLPQPETRLLKAQSDTSIHTSSTATVTDENNIQNLHKTKSRSLDNTNVAMWSDVVEFIDLYKTDRGLGFSILDYQDPLDANSTVIVVRSLIPNGAALLDGRIKPGDRLISVNDRPISNATLDQAVQILKGTPIGLVKIGVAKPLVKVQNTMQNEDEDEEEKLIVNENGEQKDS